MANPSPSKCSSNGWSSVSSSPMARMTFPHLIELRATRPTKWRSHMLTLLVPTLRPFVKLLAGQIPVRLPSSIGSTPSPTPCHTYLLTHPPTSLKFRFWQATQLHIMYFQVAPGFERGGGTGDNSRGHMTAYRFLVKVSRSSPHGLGVHGRVKY